MAKRRKAPPARKPRRPPMEEHSLLIRSAETLGRVIGALQRQLDETSRRLGAAADSRKVDGSGGNASKKKKKNVRKKKPAPTRKRTRG